MKDHIFELRSWNEDLNDNRSIMHNLKSYELSLSLKKIQAWAGFEPMTSTINRYTATATQKRGIGLE